MYELQYSYNREKQHRYNKIRGNRNVPVFYKFEKVVADQMKEEGVLETQDGSKRFNVGDYIVQRNGKQQVVEKEKFEENHIPETKWNVEHFKAYMTASGMEDNLEDWSNLEKKVNGATY